MKTKIERKMFKISGVVLMLMLLSQCSVIKSGYNGVLNRSLGKGVKVDKVYENGFAWRAPWNKIFKFNVQYKSYQEKIDILTSDELHTTIAVSAILHPKPEELPKLLLEVGMNYSAASYGVSENKSNCFALCKTV